MDLKRLSVKLIGTRCCDWQERNSIGMQIGQLICIKSSRNEMNSSGNKFSKSLYHRGNNGNEKSIRTYVLYLFVKEKK